MSLPSAGACSYHPSRPGIGVCVECRQVVCADCSTQFDGINRCAACLARLGRRPDAAAARSDLRPLNFLALLATFAVLYVGVLFLAALLSP